MINSPLITTPRIGPDVGQDVRRVVGPDGGQVVGRVVGPDVGQVVMRVVGPDVGQVVGLVGLDIGQVIGRVAGPISGPHDQPPMILQWAILQSVSGQDMSQMS